MGSALKQAENYKKHSTMTQNFYTDLPSFSNFADFTELNHYQSLPIDWLVIVTDVVSSSHAIEAGMYQAVNAISTASIVAVLNATSPLSLPYVFGGDGASACAPANVYKEVASALVAARKLARESFQLELRIGIIPMQVIAEAGYQVLVGKHQSSPHFQQAVFQGGGLQYAETLLKTNSQKNAYIINENEFESKGNFEGFECRWNEIPSAQEETVALMVQALPQANQNINQVYADILRKIFDIYGQETEHHPLLEENLSLTLSPMKLAPETMIRAASENIGKKMIYLLKAWGATAIGKHLMKNKVKTKLSDWGRYKAQLIENTDYRKFDDTLRMVLSGTKTQREQLNDFLAEKYKAEKLVYGLHPSNSAIMTCMIFNYDTEHIHFLDVSNGGYALAAQAMKKQRETLQQRNI